MPRQAPQKRKKEQVSSPWFDVHRVRLLPLSSPTAVVGARALGSMNTEIPVCCSCYCVVSLHTAATAVSLTAVFFWQMFGHVKRATTSRKWLVMPESRYIPRKQSVPSDAAPFETSIPSIRKSGPDLRGLILSGCWCAAVIIVSSCVLTRVSQRRPPRHHCDRVVSVFFPAQTWNQARHRPGRPRGGGRSRLPTKTTPAAAFLGYLRRLSAVSLD